MPNWTTNILVVAGDAAALEKFRKECTSLIKVETATDVGRVEMIEAIDFEKIVPYPEGYDPELVSPPPTSVRALAAPTFDERPDYEWIPAEVRQSTDPRHLPAYLHLQRWPLDYDEIEDAIKEVEAIAAKYNKNLELAPNCPTWYEFNVSHWGTKWNACSPRAPIFGEGCIKYEFDTAWDAPRRIYAVLNERYHDQLKFFIVAQHEDGQEVERIQDDDIDEVWLDIEMNVSIPERRNVSNS